jgi:UDP-N-acetylmuramoyl-tripeptide--D-alanyl-D-alanine ligase
MKNQYYDLFLNSSCICTDTRAIEPNSLFVCIKGENFDGNSFSENALNVGASHVIVDNPAFFNPKLSMTLVDDSVKFLQKLANHHRKQFSIPVIGITGSNGKTTTKELIRKVLSKKYNVLATKGNLNNHLGVPFTLLRITKAHEIAIIEMGANKFKDIEELCAIAEPNFGIITNIGKAHLEGFINFEGVIRTKKELYASVEKNKGKLFINSDDEVLLANFPKTIESISYGTTDNALISGELTDLSPYVEMKWKTGQYSSPILHTQMVGKYNFYNYLAAAAFGVEFGVEPEKISEAIQEYTPTNNRSQVKKTASNTLILDCYNANPTSMKSALESFAMIDTEAKYFVIGDMKELGADSREEHAKIIELIEELKLKGFTVGTEFSQFNSESVLSNFATNEAMKNHLIESPIKNNLILLKGSRSIGLEILENVL